MSLLHGVSRVFESGVKALAPFRLPLALLLLAAVAVAAAVQVQKARTDASPWLNPVVTPQEVKALDWVRRNTPERTVFATGIFEGELLMGKTLREGTLGGDWAIVPNVISRMNDVQYKLYQAPDSKTAWQTAVQYHAAYVWVPNRQTFAGYAWVMPAAVFDNAAYFEKVYDDGVRIYKVLNPPVAAVSNGTAVANATASP